MKKLKPIITEKLQIFLDYDGTLVPIQPDSTKTYAGSELLGILSELDSKYDTWIVTGRTMESIVGFIGSDFNIVGLHGLVVHRKDGVTRYDQILGKYRPLFEKVLKMNEEISQKFPGVKIRDKVGAISYTTWDMSDDDISALKTYLADTAKDMEIDFYPGIRIFELRIPGVNKGLAIRKLRNGSPALIIGDDLTDEDSFRENSDAINVKVGDGDTIAEFRLSCPDDVISLLHDISGYRPATS